VTAARAAVLAHGIGSREDLPLPLEWAIAGAAAAVVVSFLALGILWRTPRLDDPGAGRELPALQRVVDARWFRVAFAVVGWVAFAWTLLALVLGRDDARNPVPWVVFVLLWVGLVPVSVLLGPAYRQLDPVRSLQAGLHRLLGLAPENGMRPLPERLGYWPSAAGLFAFTWLELVDPDSAALPTLRWAIGLYVVGQLLAGLVFGSRWYDRGEAFETWSGLFSRLGPWGRRPSDGRLVLRAPLAGLATLEPAPGLVATVTVMLGSTAYDGLSGSTSWVSFLQSQPLPRMLVATAGLAGTISAVGVLFVVCTRVAGRLGGAGGSGMAQAFAPSVVPVALGYVVAHYY